MKIKELDEDSKIVIALVLIALAIICLFPVFDHFQMQALFGECNCFLH